jgi:hypothetical protein
MSLRLALSALVLSLAGVAVAQPAAPEAAPIAPAPADQGPVAPSLEPAPLAAPAPAPEQVPPTPAAAEPTAPPALVEPAPAPEAAPAPAEEPAAEITPKKLSVGTEGLFQPGALIQGWYQLQRTDETTNTFRIRRAEVSAKGDIIPKTISYAIMIDAARALDPSPAVVPVTNGSSDESVTVQQQPNNGPISIFQDVFATFQTEYLDISMGQFKIPVGWESNYSSAKQLFAERADVSRKYADRRDIGLRLTKTFKYFGYTAGFFNGAGQNRLDNDNGKEGGLRLEAYPLEGMTIGVVGYATLWDTDDANAKARWEVDLRYEHAPFIVQAEYIRARDVSADGAPAIKGQGFYAAAGFYLIPDKLQILARLNHLDPNVDANVNPATAKGQDELWHYEGGLTYFFAKNEAKVLLNYGYYNYQDAKDVNELIAAVQLWY